MMKSFLLEIGTDSFRGSGSHQHDRHGAAEGAFKVIVQRDREAVLEKALGQADLLGNDHAIAFHQAEPGGLGAHEPFEFLEGGGHDGPVLLGASDAAGERVDYAQAAHVQLVIIENQQQHAQPGEQAHHEVESDGQARSEGGPVEMEQQHADTEQPGTHFPARPAIANEADRQR